ncbi:hypothetical protein IW140_000900 [Coemansia sp. RSA 1813]|nr:hypothetical protein EV178_001381 [Coemansia sp. RSA 1646]KAJ1770631.1 hypothetical protein LPJ74_003006 [Coemansia sp. RSA 1843]KAJ2093441.1 hypothetical protein IW138_000291 [Coemansia sp. RSA 986]KAJ2217249.1 hypothetical protein EV179_000716 [Coemansia sp. RSA 487]KAJ2572449.1 hypothetical protein IW140_000900 [Coemansia sp. RSA 1813]
MEAEIPAPSLRAFYKTLQCLSRIGAEISFEARPHELKLIGYNAARSAYALFTFPGQFFDAYEVDPPPSNHPDPAFRCRVLAKLLVGIFKSRGPSPGHSVERCILRIEQTADPVHAGNSRRQRRTPSASGNGSGSARAASGAADFGSGECRLVVRMEYKQGICRTHRLFYEVCETLHSSYNKDECKNRWRVSSKVAAGWISHFSRGLEELSMWMSTTQVHVRSWAEGNYTGTSRTQVDAAIAETTRALRTELTVDNSEFDVYSLAAASHHIELTFGFREFKAILQYAEAMALPISAYFNKGGDPLLINVGALRHADESMLGAPGTVSTSEDLHAEFVLATISDYATPPYSITDAQAPAENKESIAIERTPSHPTPYRESVHIRSFTPENQPATGRRSHRATIDIQSTTTPQQALICERVDEISLHSEDHNHGGTQELHRPGDENNSIYDILDPKIVPSPSPYQSSRASNNDREHEWSSMRSNSHLARGAPAAGIGRRAATASADIRAMTPMAHHSAQPGGTRTSQLAAYQTPVTHVDRNASIRSYRLLDMPRPPAPPGVTDSRDRKWDDGSDNDSDDVFVADDAPPGRVQTKLPFQQAVDRGESSMVPTVQAEDDGGQQDSNTDMSSDEEVEATPPPSKRLRSLF